MGRAVFYNCNGTVTVHIRKLRVKIEENPQEPRYIQTVWGKDIGSEDMKHKSSTIYFRLVKLLIFAGLLAAAGFAAMDAAVTGILDYYFSHSDYAETQTQKSIDELQDYIEKNNVNTTDGEALTRWVKRQSIVSMQIYKNNVLTYDSNYPTRPRYRSQIPKENFMTGRPTIFFSLPMEAQRWFSTGCTIFGYTDMPCWQNCCLAFFCF